MSQLLTPTVEIQVSTRYLNEDSKPKLNRYIFAYTITISNHSEETVKLLKRHWFITDSNNNVQEVHGDGVIGQQPSIAPGDSYQYTSGAILETTAGTMEGSYDFETQAGEAFNTPIATFALVNRAALH